MKITICTLIVVLTAACNMGRRHSPGSPEQAIHNVATEYRLSGLSYLIAKDGQVIASSYANSHNTVNDYDAIVDNFQLPIVLNELLLKDTLKADIALNAYFPAIKNGYLKIKDLVFVRADHDEVPLYNQDSITGMIRRLLQRKDSGFVSTAPAGRSKNIHWLFSTLLQCANTFDQQNPMYSASPDSLIPNVFPTWYTRNLTGFFGWHVLKFERHTILWNFYKQDAQSILLLRFMDTDQFIAVAYKGSGLPTPNDYNRQDLLQSPLALALIRQVFELPQIDYQQPWDSISNHIKAFNNTPWHMLYIKELLAHAAFYERNAQGKAAAVLYKGYQQLLHNDTLAAYANVPVLVETGYVSDNENAIIPFRLDTGAYVQIFAGEQVQPISDYNDYPYQYDNVQFFINHDFIKREQTQTFHFNYRHNQVAGMRNENYPDYWLRNTAIQYAFSDPSDTTYILEIKIPWQELKGGHGRQLTMNIFVGDSDFDENRRESILSWSTGPNQGWDDPATFGLLSFAPGVVKQGHKNYYSHRAAQVPVIDGLPDAIWDQVDSSPIDLPYQNTVSPSDNSAVFKSMYDDTGLYFLVRVVDNIKNRTGIIARDRCWIEYASSRETIWKPGADTTADAPSLGISRKVFLPAGNYILRYQSDKGHSFEGWRGRPPRNDVYGASIYKARS